MLRLVLKNVANYIKGLPDENFQLAVVANGPAVTLFTNEHADLRELATPLLEQGARVVRCANALANNSIDHSRLWQGCTVVPAGLVEAVRLQREGFAYGFSLGRRAYP
ncbi:DsrE family protein [uncultured Desulfovibrio sp.]|uniref:DsrE family protein n=1 Tax=uncultured Desulfovibrio sp. TaxID=167968 RepID=UPI002632D4AF|nr:DsrE family protein [uncultured Desulfovibrio sp.]